MEIGRRAFDWVDTTGLDIISKAILVPVKNQW